MNITFTSTNFDRYGCPIGEVVHLCEEIELDLGTFVLISVCKERFAKRRFNILSSDVITCEECKSGRLVCV